MVRLLVIACILFAFAAAPVSAAPRLDILGSSDAKLYKQILKSRIAVISKPDADKGERLIAVSNEKKLSVNELRTVLKAKGHTNLWVPREVLFVKEIPKLGTGKINHRELQKHLE